MSTEDDAARYRLVADAVDTIRETAAAIVAALIADGFSDREARVITASFYSSLMVNNTTESSEADQ